MATAPVHDALQMSANDQFKAQYPKYLRWSALVAVVLRPRRAAPAARSPSMSRRPRLEPFSRFAVGHREDRHIDCRATGSRHTRHDGRPARGAK